MRTFSESAYAPPSELVDCLSVYEQRRPYEDKERLNAFVYSGVLISVKILGARVLSHICNYQVGVEKWSVRKIV